MSNMANMSSTEETRSAYRRGWKVGLATSALALSLLSFLNLFGIEKSLLAMLLGYFALKGGDLPLNVKRRGMFAMIIAGLHVVTVVVVLILFREELTELIHLLQQLG